MEEGRRGGVEYTGSGGWVAKGKVKGADWRRAREVGRNIGNEAWRGRQVVGCCGCVELRSKNVA